jgi:vancomycin resistance protein YoaR
LGGGICQVSTTLFNAALFAGLEIVERKNHSIYIDHYPKGRDATVTAGSPNMRFRNDTDHYILVRGASDGVTTTFVIYGTPTGRKVDLQTSDFYDIVPMEKVEYNKSALSPGKTEIKTAGQEGKSIKVVRTVKSKSGEVSHKDTFVSIWKMMPRETYIGVGKTTTTTKAPSTSTTEKPTATSTSTTTTEAAPEDTTF